MSKSRRTLSLVMIVKDEEEALGRCLASAESLVDEIIVVDTGSTDSTVSIAEEAGAKILHHPWEQDFSAPRNTGLEAATSDWILHLDADEEIVASQSDMATLLGDKYLHGYFVNLVNGSDVSALSEPKEIFPAIRLFRNLPELRYQKPIHEQIIINNETRRGYAEGISILHYGPYLGRSTANKFKRNTTILEAAIKKEPENGYFQSMIGREYFLSEDYEAALGHYQAAIDIVGATKSWSPPVFRDMAYCLHRVKRTGEAMGLLRDLSGTFPLYTDFVFMEGMILWEVGDNSSAKNAFLRCIKMGDPPTDSPSMGGTGTWRAENALKRCE